MDNKGEVLLVCMVKDEKRMRRKQRKFVEVAIFSMMSIIVGSEQEIGQKS